MKQSKTTRLLLSVYRLSDSQKFKRLTLMGIAGLLFLFISDVHRFGAWYLEGAATYIKPYWIYLVIALWIPVVLYLFSAGLKLIVKHNSYNLLSVIIIGGFIFLFFFLWTGWSLSPDVWYNINIIRDVDRKFWEVLLIPLVIAVIIGLNYYIGKKRDNESR